jgi:cytosine/adenosine deaminase-related metal-dependent hydrolase
MRLVEAEAGLVWCPSSNKRLFGQTADVGELIRHGRVALGTDSRFSGSRDLLAEIAVAHENGTLAPRTLESLVTRDAAALLRVPDRGVLKVGARADLLVLPAGMALCEATRADIRLVVLGGKALYADADYARLFAPPTHWAVVRVDGKSKMLESRLVAALCAATVGEAGLEMSRPAGAAA